MTKWYDRVGNTIEMLIDNVWVKGRVVNGYRTGDGAVNMISENGKECWCGSATENVYFRKCNDSIGDLITVGDKIRSMNNEEMAEFLTVQFLNGVGKDLILKWITTEVEV